MSEPVLGRSVDPSEYGRLDTFPVDAPVRCRFETAELEALCPAVPGIQPDIYRATIDFVAVTHAIESKSLKLWLVTFRDRRVFAEHLAAEIGQRIEGIEGVQLLGVTLVQNVRGGLAETVVYPSDAPSPS